MRIRLLPLVALSLIIAGCGDGETTTDQTSATVTTTATSSGPGATDTTTARSSPTTTEASTGSTGDTSSASTSTTAATTATTAAAGVALLDDGRPSTFLAVTHEYEAVEVDTVTGEVVRFIGQTGTPADFDGEEEMDPNVIDGVWRSADGSSTYVSECCEPAAGVIFFLDPDDVLTQDGRGSSTTDFGWSAAPAPTGDRYALLNEALAIKVPGGAEPVYQLWIPDAFDTFATGFADWTTDATTLYWLGERSEATYLHWVDLSAEEPVEGLVALPWVGEDQALWGVGVQASGNLVAFAHTWNTEGEITDSLGVVFDSSGALVADFPVETGSYFGAYDPSGTYLIYTDADGTVRWRGNGRSGELGSGYFFASW